MPDEGAFVSESEKTCMSVCAEEAEKAKLLHEMIHVCVYIGSGKSKAPGRERGFNVGLDRVKTIEEKIAA